MAEALAFGRTRSSEPLQGRMKIVPAHMA